MIKIFRTIYYIILIFFIFSFIITDMRINNSAFAYDREHDSGHNRSNQDPNDRDNPNDDDNQDDDEDPIEMLTGNLKYEHEDLSFLCGRNRVSLTRYYNSNDRYNGPLGYGWNFNFNMKAIRVFDENQEYVIIRGFSGKRFKFKKLNDGTYEPPVGWHMTLTGSLSAGFSLQESTGKIFEFNSDGDLSLIKSCCNPGQTTLTYDSSKRLIAIQSSNSSFSCAYNDQNKIQSIEDQVGRKVYYYYNEKEELTEFQGIGGKVLRYSYDEKHNLAGILNGNGELLLQNTYNDSDQVIEQTNQRGTFTFSYDLANLIITITDTNGKTRIHKLNEHGQPLEITDQYGNTEYYTWNSQHQLIQFINRNGEIIQYEYDGYNRSKVILQDDREIRFDYNENNRMTSQTDLSDNTTGWNTTLYEYNVNGALERRLSPSGRFTGYTYDGNGRIASIYDALTDDPGSTPMYRFTYGTEGQVSHITYPNDSYEYYEYNELGKKKKWITRSDSEIYYGFNDSGLMDKVSYKVGTSYLIYTYQYDAQGNLTQVTDPFGKSIVIKADKYDRLSELTDPLGNKITYEYTNGKLSKRTDAKGQETQYEYDFAGRHVRTIYPNSSEINYTYDNLGRVTSADNGTISVSFTYDLLGNISQIQCPYLEKTVDYEYTSSGSIDNITVTDQADSDKTYAFSYGYDPDKLLTDISSPDNSTALFEYDDAGKIVTTTYSNSIAKHITYDDMGLGLVEKIVFKKGETTLKQIQYAFDSFGNITGKNDNGTVTAYEYDDLNRLTKVTFADNSTIEYTYDFRDNRSTMTTGSGTVTYTYDDAGRLLSDGTVTYAYDNSGNLITKTQGSQITTFTYDYENRLKKISLPDSTIILYSHYPAMPFGAEKLAELGNQIISKVKGSQETRYLVNVDMDAIMSLGNDNSFQTWYAGGIQMDDIVVSNITDNSTTSARFYLRDILSTVSALADSTGSIINTYEYSPYGTPDPAGIADPFGFTGRTYQPDSGLVYYRARFYDPQIGRFISKDRFKVHSQEPRRYNPYAYVLNNPINYIDPTGYEDKCPSGLWTGVGAAGEGHFVIGVWANTITVCCTTKPSLCCGFVSVGGSLGAEASASADAIAVQFINCPTAGDIAGWGGGVSGEVGAAGSVDAGVSVGTTGCISVSGGAGGGVGGGASFDFGYTWNTGCTY